MDILPNANSEILMSDRKCKDALTLSLVFEMPQRTLTYRTWPHIFASNSACLEGGVRPEAQTMLVHSTEPQFPNSRHRGGGPASVLTAPLSKGGDTCPQCPCNSAH